MNTDDNWKLIVDLETGCICRVVHFCLVDYNYIITPVSSISGKWNDMRYDGVKINEIRELTSEEKDSLVIKLLKDSK